MSPITHLLASWAVGAKTTENQRDCRLVTLAGVLPDLDGAGLLIDMADGLLDQPIHFFYATWHHYLLHGLAGGLLIAGALSIFARQRWRVFGLALLVFHLHLLCDFLGSRGPDLADVWTIHYLGPFTRHPVWFWTGQWALDAWQNRAITLALLGAALWFPTHLGYSVIGVFHSRADQAVVRTLQQWRARLLSSPRSPAA